MITLLEQDRRLAQIVLMANSVVEPQQLTSAPPAITVRMTIRFLALLVLTNQLLVKQACLDVLNVQQVKPAVFLTSRWTVQQDFTALLVPNIQGPIILERQPHHGMSLPGMSVSMVVCVFQVNIALMA